MTEPHVHGQSSDRSAHGRCSGVEELTQISLQKKPRLEEQQQPLATDQCGPQVVVTSQAVVQPNSDLEASPPAVVARGKSDPFNDLLERMTKQLQQILTKLSDRSLSGETREKYDTLAQNIQLQIAKISKPEPAKVMKRGYDPPASGCKFARRTEQLRRKAPLPIEW